MNMRTSLSSGTAQGNDLLPSSDAPIQQSPEGSDPLPWWQQPLHWWYYLTAPPEAPANAPLAQREKARRGRLASVVLLFTVLLVLPAFPTAVGNPILLGTLLIVLAIDAIAFILNRSGWTTLAGVLVVVGIELGLGTSILTIPGGFGVGNLDMLDLLVQAECVTVSLLAPQSVFLVALINSAFFIYVLTLSHVRPELASLLAVDGSRVISSPIILQIIVALVTFLWVSGANKAIVRADRAEEIAALEQQKLELQERELEQKRQLDFGIEQILQTHVRVANGDFKARAPLSQDNVLWQIARSLNNLLARLQGYSLMSTELQRAREENARLHMALQTTSHAQNELQHTKEAAFRLAEALKHARGGYTFLPFSLRSGTIIDTVITELRAVNPSSSEQGHVNHHYLDKENPPQTYR